MSPGQSNLLFIAFFAIIIPQIFCQTTTTEGLLYPRASETRNLRSLDGIWNFIRSDTNDPAEGIREQWFLKDLRLSNRTVINMPVPASYNDVVEDDKVRDHVGRVWYDRKFFVPTSWQGQRVWIRFGSINYEAQVWINGDHVAEHVFGHLPFEAEITNQVKYGKENRITILVDNTLTPDSIPQGKIVERDNDDGKVTLLEYTFDYFHYAGIHRSVHLYTTPETYIKELHVDTSVDKDGHGHVYFKIIPNEMTVSANVTIYDKKMNMVVSQAVNSSMIGEAIISRVNKWWPYLMNPDPGYLYTIEVRLLTQVQQNVDIYRMKFGVRTLKWTDTMFLINDKPVYFRGFGKHEDSDVNKFKYLDGFYLTLLYCRFVERAWIWLYSQGTSIYCVGLAQMLIELVIIRILRNRCNLQTNMEL